MTIAAPAFWLMPSRTLPISRSRHVPIQRSAYRASFLNSGAPAGIEEERRVLYVAMTRAKTNLFISSAENVTSGRLIYAEARAALAQAVRLGRLAADDLAVAIEELASLYDQLDVLEIDDLLVRRAGELAQRHALRGYDAVHLAAAERVQNGTTVMVAGDGDLCAAAEEIGMAVARTHGAGG
jgi:predicted nucleic acid-binding protein